MNKSQNEKKDTLFNSWLMIIFDYGKKDISDLLEYQSELEKLVNSSGLGEVDGHDVAVDLSDGVFWIVCKDALQVFSLVKDSLTQTTLVKIKEVKKRDVGEDQYSVINMMS